MGFAVVAQSSSRTNTAIAAAGGGRILRPREALLTLGPGDVAPARIDVLDTLDGPEPGLPEL